MTTGGTTARVAGWANHSIGWSGSLREKNPVFIRPRLLQIHSHPVPLRGALAIVTNVGTGSSGRVALA